MTVEIYSTGTKTTGKLHLSSHICPKVRAGGKTVVATAESVAEAVTLYPEERFCTDCFGRAQSALQRDAEAQPDAPEGDTPTEAAEDTGEEAADSAVDEAEAADEDTAEEVAAEAAPEEPSFVQVSGKRARLGEQVALDAPEGVVVRWIAPASWRGVRDYAIYAEDAVIGFVQVKDERFRAFCKVRGRACLGARAELGEAVALIHREHVTLAG